MCVRLDNDNERDLAVLSIVWPSVSPSDRWSVGRVTVGGRSSVVEFQPSKLAVVGSNPIARSKSSVLDRGADRACEGGLRL